jgi:SOS-response transcriptional repressor LexA
MSKKKLKKKTEASVDSFAHRMKERRLELGLKQVQAAAKAGISPQLWSRIEHGEIKSSGQKTSISRALEVDIYYLETGRLKNQDEIIFISGKHEERIKIDKKHSIIQILSPIITWEQAGKTIFSARDVKGSCKNAQRYQKSHIESFVLVMDGDSMQNPSITEPSFMRGDMLHFDPVASTQPKPGDYVIARHKKERTAIFRQLVTDCGKQYLVAHNPRYPAIELTDDIKIFGILIFQGRDLRS